MAAAAGTVAESSVDTPTRWTGWFASLGGAAAWTAHLMLAYLVSEFGCVSGIARWSALGVSSLSWILIALSVVTFAIAVLATLAGYATLRTPGWPHDLGGDPPQTIAGGRYLARLGIVLSALFAVTILGQSLPLLWYLDGCGGGAP